MADDLDGMLEPFDEAFQRLGSNVGVLPVDGLNERAFVDLLFAELSHSAGPGWASVSRERSSALKFWPGVGPVDLVLETAASQPLALLEVKWMALENCAWDMAKLALALHEGVAETAYLIAGAPQEMWDEGDRGAQLFDARSWRADTLLDRFEGEFGFWRNDVKTHPRMLPCWWTVTDESYVPAVIDAEPWELRCVRIEIEDPPLVGVHYPARAGYVPPEEDPQREWRPIEPEASPLADLDRDAEGGLANPASALLAAEGGTVRSLDPSGLRLDEGTLSDLTDTDHEPRDLWFPSATHRRAYLEERGWRAPRDGRPEVFEIYAGSGMGASFRLAFDGRELHVERRPWDGAPSHDVIEPAPVAWRALWRRLDHLDIWWWQPHYEPFSQVMDGFGWEVRISAGGRSCHSEGNHAFPDGGISDSAATWSGFVLALQDLVGGIELYDL